MSSTGKAMTTPITKEQQKQILIDTANHVINRENTGPYSENLRELARIALAAMNSEPFGYVSERCMKSKKLGYGGVWEFSYTPLEVGRVTLKLPLYAAPPAPVVPLTDEQIDAVLDTNSNIAYVIADKRERLRMFAREILRAAMLQSQSEQPQNAQQNIPENIPGGNSPVIPDDWITAVNRLLDSDGSRGCYRAIEMAEARRELEQLLAAQQVGSVSN